MMNAESMSDEVGYGFIVQHSAFASFPFPELPISPTMTARLTTCIAAWTRPAKRGSVSESLIPNP